MREEGEISDEDSDEEIIQIRRPRGVKRERNSRSPSGSGEGRPSQRGRQHENSFEQERQDWNEYYRESPRPRNSNHMRSSYERNSQPENSRDHEFGANNFSGLPRAHSTAGARREPVPSTWHANEPSRHHVTQNSGNSSMRTNNKMFKVEPYPKGVKPTDQYHEWTFWQANFEMAIEKAGITDQRARAIDMSLHIGEEMRRVIVAKNMLPKESTVPSDFPFYDNLSQQLEVHFRSLTDESVDVSRFNTLKQGEKESALEFELRLHQMAKRVNETNSAMIRTRFIEGLRDQSLRERAFIDGVSLQEVVRMATRKEAIMTKHETEFSPWKDDRNAVSVAAISQNAQPTRYNRKSNNQGVRERDGYKKSWGERRNPERNLATRGDEGCKRCGIVEHRAGVCPAQFASCFKCGQVGHFRHMCANEVREVTVNETKEVPNGVYH